MKILVVDDKKMALAALSKKLSDKGCSVSAVDNSLDALHVINQQKTDLIISDIVMPPYSISALP